MNTHTDTKLAVEIANRSRETENPMQERHCERVAESPQVAAKAVFEARRLEVREEAGPVLVP